MRLGAGTAMLTVSFQAAAFGSHRILLRWRRLYRWWRIGAGNAGGRIYLSARRNIWQRRVLFHQRKWREYVGGTSTWSRRQVRRWSSVRISAPRVSREPIFQNCLGLATVTRCDNQSMGAFNVLDIQYGSGSTITSFAADFVQFDELSTSWWNIGSIRYNSTVPITYPAPPVVVSASASPINLTSETLNAAVNPAGPPTAVYFQYGATNAYGSTTTTQNLLAGVTGAPVTATLTGLQASVIYHYRVVATSSWGTSMSADATFATATSSPVIFSTANAGGTQGQPFTYQIQATNSPSSYAASGLPSGLTLNTATGLISGTVTQAGTYPATLSATNSSGTGTAALTITINALPSLSPANLSPAYAGSAYQQTLLVTGGTTPYTSLSISNFNAGTTGLTSTAITTNTAGTVTLSGTPTAAGSLSFTVNVTDTAGATASANYTLTVNAALNPPTLQALPAFVAALLARSIGMPLPATGPLYEGVGIGCSEFRHPYCPMRRSRTLPRRSLG